MNRFRNSIAVFWALLSAAVCLADEGKEKISLSATSGKAIVEKLDFQPAEIKAVNAKSLTFIAADDKSRSVSLWFVFEEKDVDGEPLTGIAKTSLNPQEYVKFAKLNDLYLIMKLKPAPKEVTKPESPPVTPSPAPPTTRVPTLEEVKDVLVLDSQKKQDQFELLTRPEKTKLLTIAGNISGMKDVLSYKTRDDIDLLAFNLNLFKKDKAVAWIIERADNRGAKEFVELMKTPADKVESVKIEYSFLSSMDCRRACKIAKSISESGLGSLFDDSKKFVRLHSAMFGID